MQPSKIKLTDLSGAAVLIGSMLSSDDTSGLPAGQTVSARLVEKIVRTTFGPDPTRFGLTAGDVNRIERLAYQTPFEVLLHDHPEPKLAGAKLSTLYRGGTPNALHQALASAVTARHVADVITTNYDPCIEEKLGRGNVQLVFNERQEKALDWSSSRLPIVFKIHGCALDEPSMIFRLAQEGALPAWKRRLLTRLISGRDLAVMGYSGLDFDICPILFNLPYNRMFWLRPVVIPVSRKLDGVWSPRGGDHGSIELE